MKTSTIKLSNHEMKFDIEEGDMVFRSTLEIRIPEARAAKYSLPGLALCAEIQYEDLIDAYSTMACDFDNIAYPPEKSDGIIMDMFMDAVLSIDVDKDIEESDVCDCPICQLERLVEDLNNACA